MGKALGISALSRGRPGLYAAIRQTGRTAFALSKVANIEYGKLMSYVHRDDSYVSERMREELFAELGEVFDLYPKWINGSRLARAPEGFRMTGHLDPHGLPAEGPPAWGRMESEEATERILFMLFYACKVYSGPPPTNPETYSRYVVRVRRNFYILLSVLDGERQSDVAGRYGLTRAMVGIIVHKVREILNQPFMRRVWRETFGYERKDNHG